VALTRFTRGYTTLLLVALSLSTPAWARPTATAAKSSAAATIGIDNFGQVNASYYRGAQPQERDYTDLASLGIKTIIDLTKDGSPAEPALVKGAGMRFFRIPMTTHAVPTAEQITQFMRIVNDPADQPVYVHCQGGRHRTGVMTAIYRMTKDRWTPDQAFAEMKRFKFGADYLHAEFKRFVYDYHVDVATDAVVPARSVGAGS
jgi:tyrosine-protein phosphatase SIW14